MGGGHTSSAEHIPLRPGSVRVPLGEHLQGPQTASVPLETILEGILCGHRTVGSQQCWEMACAGRQET